MSTIWTDKIRYKGIKKTMFYMGAKVKGVYRNDDKIRGFYLEDETFYEKCKSMYFTIESLEDNNDITLYNTYVPSNNINIHVYYSLDDGDTWVTPYLPPEGLKEIVINVDKYEKILFKASISWQIGFKTTGRYKAYGNVMSLIYGDNFIGQTSLGYYGYTFYGMFAESPNDEHHLVDAMNLILPATTLKANCYDSMFAWCAALVYGPRELPATTVLDNSYDGMFIGCTSLVNAPVIYALELGYKSCEYMFRECTSLVTAPDLLATTLAQYCYRGMFYGCTALSEVPYSLPATTLEPNCYNAMFLNCTSLVTAPVLPAATLKSSCYSSMFYGCSSLRSITCYATDRSPYNCLDYWVYGVSLTGDFYKKSSSWTSTGNSQIPAGWTQHNI